MSLDKWATNPAAEAQTHICVNLANTAAVNQRLYWIDVRKVPPPLGVQLLLANRNAGRAVLGQFVSGDSFWTHWQGLPRFLKEDDAS